MINATAIHMQDTSEDTLFEILKRRPFNTMYSILRELLRNCATNGTDFHVYLAKRSASLEANGWDIKEYNLKDYDVREKGRYHWAQTHV